MCLGDASSRHSCAKGWQEIAHSQLEEGGLSEIGHVEI